MKAAICTNRPPPLLSNETLAKRAIAGNESRPGERIGHSFAHVRPRGDEIPRLDRDAYQRKKAPKWGLWAKGWRSMLGAGASELAALGFHKAAGSALGGEFSEHCGI